jgi:hypothetical protein
MPAVVCGIEREPKVERHFGLFGFERHRNAREPFKKNQTVPPIADWLTEQGRRALPKSPIGYAIAYAQSNWAALCRFPEHGELSIDNNLAERMLRAQAIGPKNYTFLGSDRCGRTAAVLYSFTGTCRHHEIDPFAYLRDIFRRLPPIPRISSRNCCPMSGSHPTPRHVARGRREPAARGPKSAATHLGAECDTITVRWWNRLPGSESRRAHGSNRQLA